jgi:hypothetical protein
MASVSIGKTLSLGSTEGHTATTYEFAKDPEFNDVIMSVTTENPKELLNINVIIMENGKPYNIDNGIYVRCAIWHSDKMSSWYVIPNTNCN